MASSAHPSRIFPRLPPGRSTWSAKRKAEHQRGRLMGAMVEGLGRHGYEKVTVAELVALAGVSNRDFYRLFSSKEECFLATFEEILKRTTLEVRHGYRQGACVRERMLSAVSAFAELITANQAV